MRMLIVEDDYPTAETLCTICKEHWGITDCDIVKNVEKAVNYLQTNRPDVILLDLLLGDGLSVPVVDFAKKRYPLRPPKIVAISALVNAETIARRSGIEVLKKPFSIETLEEYIFKK